MNINNQKEEKEKFEVFCFNYLRPYYKEKFNSFTKGEKPDFQSTQYSIGVELTETANTEYGQQMAFCRKVLKCTTKDEAIQISDKYFNGKYKNYICDIDNNITGYFISHDTSKDSYETNLIYQAIEKKLSKLKNYKQFDTNILFLFDMYTFIDKEIIDNTIINQIRKIEEEQECHFDEYIIVRPTIPTYNLYTINTQNNQCKHFTFKYEEES